MKSISNKILSINIVLLILTITIYFIIKDLEITNDLLYYVFLYILIFGLSIGGICAGIVERKYNLSNPKVGIIGNSIIIFIWVIVFILSIETPSYDNLTGHQITQHTIMV